MKKLFLMLAAGFMAVSANAQNTAITANKAESRLLMVVSSRLLLLLSVYALVRT